MPPPHPPFPPAFVRQNAADPAWLAALPALLVELAARWGLVVAPPYPGIIFNYVAPAVRSDGELCVLKVSRYLSDTRNEIAALRLWDGDGAARLLAADPAIGALLIERVAPGTMLTEVAADDDDTATAIAAGMLRHLWRPAPPDHGLRTLDSWCDAYERNRQALSRGADGFPAALFLRADDLRRDLLTSTTEQTVLHGDLHHYNILRAERAPWLAIDPKGLLGDRPFDICQFLRNPRDEPTLPLMRRRVDRFCADLELDRERTKAWCLVHAILDACWQYEDGESWREAVARAELMTQL